MSEADDRISMGELAVLIGGSQREVVERLKAYEMKGIVKPEMRKVPIVLPPSTVHKFPVTNFIGGPSNGRSELDAWYEDRRSEGLPPLKAVHSPKLVGARYYSRDDTKSLAPHERVIAPLPPEFCRWTWGTEVDPEAVPVCVAASFVATCSPPIPQPLTTALLRLRLERKGVLFNRKGRVRKLERLTDDPDLILAARINSPARGQTSLWDEAAVLKWLADSGHRWSADGAKNEKIKDGGDHLQLDHVWNRALSTG